MAIEIFEAYLVGNQTNVSNTGAFTLAELAASPINEGAYFDTTTFEYTPPAGVVDLYAQAHFNTLNANGGDFQVAIAKNGVRIAVGEKNAPGVTIPCQVSDRANGTDVYTMLYCGPGSSGPLTVTDNDNKTCFGGKAYGAL